MAKKIKFPLKMKNGALVRTLEELKENFDIESLLEHYESGKLIAWLEDRYYDVEIQKISELNHNTKNFHLCSWIFQLMALIFSDKDIIISFERKDVVKTNSFLNP